jgi:hypothetical protein
MPSALVAVAARLFSSSRCFPDRPSAGERCALRTAAPSLLDRRADAPAGRSHNDCPLEHRSRSNPIDFFSFAHGKVGFGGE